jgi:hypothetical protein
MNVADVLKTRDPEPVDVVATADARFALVGVASHVATPVPRPVTPPTATAVAVMDPEPDADIEAPVPTTIAAAVLVPLVMPLKANEAPPEALRTPPDKVRFVPIVTSLNTPLLLNPASVLAVLVAMAIVPEAVIGPPVRPVPVSTSVTVPEPAVPAV